MKKVLFAAVSALTVASVAVAADSTQFGVLKVPSTAEQTIVAVPWLESATADSPVCISNLVLTAGLTAGDELKWYNSSTGKYECWTLAKGSDNVLYWQAGNNVTEVGSEPSGNPSVTTLARGQAILLKRQNHTGGFYIMGKPATSAATSLDLASGTAESAAYTLIAPPSVSDTKINNDLGWENLEAGLDVLLVGDPETGAVTSFKWSGSRWKSGETVEYTIKAGMGVWFKSNGTQSGKKVLWTKAN